MNNEAQGVILFFAFVILAAGAFMIIGSTFIR
jgi:hypothetical protein